MNILFLFGHDLVIGGHFKSAQAFIYELTRQGHKIHVMAPNGRFETITPFLRAGATFSDINYKKNLKGIHRILNIFRINDQIRKIIKDKKIDIIHAQDSPSLEEGFKAACFLGKPFLLTQAGGKFVNFFPPKKIPFILYSIELYKGYSSLYRKLDLHIITERINHDIFKPEKACTPNFNLEFPKDGLTFFFSMRLHEQKKSWIDSLFYFAEKIDFLQTTTFIIAGDGSLKKSMIERSNALKQRRINVNFIFIGNINDDSKLNQFINFSHLSIGIGRSLMEAMACQKPVIILGERNQFELIDSKNIKIIREYNFSGRHFNEILYDEFFQESKIKDAIRTDILDQYGKFCLTYCENFLAASIGAEKLTRVYGTALAANQKKPNTRLKFWNWFIGKYFFKYILSIT